MEWYFLENGQRTGPLTDEQFDEAVRAGRVLAGSFVWRPGMADWTTLSVYQAWQDSRAPAEGDPRQGGLEVRYCGQCGKSFHVEDIIMFHGLFVCAECKSVFFQRLREGSLYLPAGVAKTYQVAAGAIANIPAGQERRKSNVDFGGRLAAWLIDAMLVLFIVLIVDGILSNTIGMQFSKFMDRHFGFSHLAEFVVISIIYHSLLTGMFSASLGKLLFGQRIVRSDGGKIDLGMGFMRSLVRLVSFATLGYGFLMIMWDKDCLGLHDKICDTKVVRK
ncbi:MAG: RDD family protein [Planctomycetes bacterium]|nr:RDD family protein [Planctomycetota bacterium]